MESRTCSTPRGTQSGPRSAAGCWSCREPTSPTWSPPERSRPARCCSCSGGPTSRRTRRRGTAEDVAHRAAHLADRAAGAPCNRASEPSARSRLSTAVKSPGAVIEAQIDLLLAVGVGENPRESLSELAKLGARLIIQRAVEDEFDAWLGRARYERRPEAPPGLRNGFRPRRVQTAEGELAVEIPQVREAAEPFVSKLFPQGTKLLRTEPLRAMVIGAFVRGLSMRDIESLCEQAGLGKLSKSTAARICTELRDRFAAFQRRDLYDIHLAALFLDAVFLSVRRDGPKEGVLVAWGFTEDGERVLLSVMLGMRESHEDWLALGRDLIARGLGAPMLIVADGAPGLIKAVEQCWPAS